jgi:hypothetical protein
MTPFEIALIVGVLVTGIALVVSGTRAEKSVR